MEELLDMQENRDFCDYEDCIWVENLGLSFQTMRQDRDLTDITLFAGDSEFPCHRILLAASSPFFKALFTGPMREETQEKFNLRDTVPAIAELLLDFMYTGKLRITKENVQDLLVSANFLLLGRLVDACSDFLRRQLDCDNCFAMYSFAEVHGCGELKRAAQRYILKNFREVSSSSAFLEISFEQLSMLLGHDSLSISSELDIFLCLDIWVSHDRANRTSKLAELLKFVRLPYLSHDTLYEMSNNVLVAACPKCRMVLQNAHLCKSDVIPYPHEWRSPRRSTNQVEVLVVLGGVEASRPGKSSSSLQHYWCNPATQPFSWNKHSIMPHVLRNTVMYDVAKFQNAIYVIGGFDGELGTLRHVWKYQMEEDLSDMWTRAPSLIKARYQHGSAVVRGRLYAIGGYDGEISLSDVECYSPEEDHWQSCPPMPEAVTFPAAVGYHERLFVIGGMKAGSCAFPWMQCYDTSTQNWSIIKTLELKTKGSKSILLNDAIYIVGGPSRDVHVYDPENDVTFDVAPTHDFHVCAGVTVNNGKIYIAGGDTLTDHKNWDSIECYDPASNTWSNVGKLPAALYWHGLVSIVRNVCVPRPIETSDFYQLGPSMMFRGFEERLPQDYDPR